MPYKIKISFLSLFMTAIFFSACTKEDISSFFFEDKYLLDGDGIDWPNQLLDLGNEGLLVAGYTTSTDLNHEAHGEWDGLVIRLDAQLDTLWVAVLGGPGFDAFTDAIAVDGGFILCGYKSISGHQKDLWVIKINEAGQIEWESLFGGTKGDQAFGIEEILPGMYGVIGFSASTDAPEWLNNGKFDGVALAIDQTGELLWSTHIGGSSDDTFTSLVTDELGNMYIGGFTASHDGAIPQNQGYNDLWYVRLSSGGDLLTSQTIGTEGDELGLTISKNGDFVLISGAQSNLDLSLGTLQPTKWHMVLLTVGGDFIWNKTLVSSFPNDCAFASCVSSANSFYVSGRKTDDNGVFKQYTQEVDLAGNAQAISSMLHEGEGTTLSVAQKNNYIVSASTYKSVAQTNSSVGILVLKTSKP